MSDEDALLWNIEKDPVLRSTIIAAAFCDRAPDWDRLRSRFERATLLIPRLRQRVVSPPLRIGPPRWSVERDFDLDYHMRRLHVPPPGTRRAVLDLLAPMAAGSFDRARPLWECTVLEGLEGGGAALVLKVHHSVTDGVGGMEMLLHLVDFDRDAAEPGDRPAAPIPDDVDVVSLVRESLGHTRRRVFGIARRVPGTVVGGAIGAARDPVGTLADAYVTTRSIVRTLAPANQPMSPVMVQRGLTRRLDTIDIPVDDLKRAAKMIDGSLNDAFVAGVIGGLQRYHQRHGAAPPALRMTMPINLRTAADTPAGNKFTPARFPVPAMIDDPRERMLAVHELVRGWRAEPALALTGALAGVLNRLPTIAVTGLFGSMLKGCDFVTTNIPGAPLPVYVGGARVDRFYAFAPPAGSSANVALISHCDTCCIGVVSDAAAIPDSDVLVQSLEDGLAEVIALG
jgi:WS/DGAT/MGAT family acyltransferase